MDEPQDTPADNRQTTHSLSPWGRGRGEGATLADNSRDMRDPNTQAERMVQMACVLGKDAPSPPTPLPQGERGEGGFAALELPVWSRHLVPSAFFWGVVLGFVACCLGGFIASRHNPFGEVERFHIFLSPETLCYPTASQLREFARERLDPAKVAVIVGGSSRLHGSGQPQGQVWTRHLQARLGEKYQVLNLGFRGARSAEAGAVVAEMLLQDHPRLIFLTDCHPGRIDPRPDGHIYRYLFWDARTKGLLLPDAERDARLAELAEEDDGLRLRMELDRWCRFTDLWNGLGCDRFFTLWTPLTRKSTTRPRRLYRDKEPGPLPLDQRYQNDEEALRFLQGHLAACSWPDFEHGLRTSFVAPLRSRTLMLAIHCSSHYRGKLSPADEARLTEAMRRTVEACERVGMAGLEVGRDFEPADYADLQHLAPPGGAKLAETVAPKVEELAKKLGYVEGVP